MKPGDSDSATAGVTPIRREFKLQCDSEFKLLGSTQAGGIR